MLKLNHVYSTHIHKTYTYYILQNNVSIVYALLDLALSNRNK